MPELSYFSASVESIWVCLLRCANNYKNQLSLLRKKTRLFSSTNLPCESKKRAPLVNSGSIRNFRLTGWKFWARGQIGEKDNVDALLYTEIEAGARAVNRVARLFLVQHTKTGENIPNNQKICIPNCLKYTQMAIQYSNIFHLKTLQNLP
jgi:hypothetical protein